MTARRLVSAERQQFQQILGRALRKRRCARGVTQRQLADAMGMSRNTICNIEAGRHMPRVDALWLAAEYLDVPIATILPQRAS